MGVIMQVLLCRGYYDEVFAVSCWSDRCHLGFVPTASTRISTFPRRSSRTWWCWAGGHGLDPLTLLLLQKDGGLGGHGGGLKSLLPLLLLGGGGLGGKGKGGLGPASITTWWLH